MAPNWRGSTQWQCLPRGIGNEIQDRRKPTTIEVAQLLREAGHDVYSVHEQGLVGAKDRVLAEVCRSENRAMVTLGTHFADIRTYPPEKYSGLIVLRLARQDKPHVLEVMKPGAKATFVRIS